LIRNPLWPLESGISKNYEFWKIVSKAKLHSAPASSRSSTKSSLFKNRSSLVSNDVMIAVTAASF